MQIDRDSRWGGESVTVQESVFLGAVPSRLPTFSRVPLTTRLEPERGDGLVSRWLNGGSRAPLPHRYLDVIVRRSDAQLEDDTPIALVSKKYALVQHHDVVDRLLGTLGKHDPKAAILPTSLTLSEYGGRMALEVRLPQRFDSPDEHELAPTLYCWNSVDGSRPLEISFGWIRLVCANGLIVGQMQGKERRRHIRSMALQEVDQQVERGLASMADEANRLQGWASVHVPPDTLASWIDNDLTAAWGPINAARVFNIVRDGHDVRLLDSPRGKLPPSRRRCEPLKPVPGSAPPNDNLFRVAQAMSWLAGRRLEVESRQTRLLQIPSLIASLKSRVTTRSAQPRRLERTDMKRRSAAFRENFARNMEKIARGETVR